MVDTLNLLLLKKYETTPATETSGEFIDDWLKTSRNYIVFSRNVKKYGASSAMIQAMMLNALSGSWEDALLKYADRKHNVKPTATRL